jgi:hypothetical protein
MDWSGLKLVHTLIGASYGSRRARICSRLAQSVKSLVCWTEGWGIKSQRVSSTFVAKIYPTHVHFTDKLPLHWQKLVSIYYVSVSTVTPEPPSTLDIITNVTVTVGETVILPCAVSTDHDNVSHDSSNERLYTDLSAHQVYDIVYSKELQQGEVRHFYESLHTHVILKTYANLVDAHSSAHRRAKTKKLRIPV